MDELMNEQSGRVSVGRQSVEQSSMMAGPISFCANAALLEAASVDRPGWECLELCHVGCRSHVPGSLERGVPCMPAPV